MGLRDAAIGAGRPRRHVPLPEKGNAPSTYSEFLFSDSGSLQASVLTRLPVFGNFLVELLSSSDR